MAYWGDAICQSISVTVRGISEALTDCKQNIWLGIAGAFGWDIVLFGMLGVNESLG
jgi:hypothetical protein